MCRSSPRGRGGKSSVAAAGHGKICSRAASFHSERWNFETSPCEIRFVLRAFRFALGGQLGSLATPGTSSGYTPTGNWRPERSERSSYHPFRGAACYGGCGNEINFYFEKFRPCRRYRRSAGKFGARSPSIEWLRRIEFREVGLRANRFHDFYRVFDGGKERFDRIWSSISLLEKSSIRDCVPIAYFFFFFFAILKSERWFDVWSLVSSLIGDDDNTIVEGSMSERTVESIERPTNK